jgi:hypothetical protein
VIARESFRDRRTAHGGAYNPGHAYDFGLQRVLDGLATLIDRLDR